MIITSINNNGIEVDLEYGEDIAPLVREIVGAAGVDEDGVIQAEDAARIFGWHRPELHTTMSEYGALMAAGCEPSNWGRRD